jgi:hypothetical protein
MEKTLEIHIRELREKIAREIESIDIDNSKSNALGVKIIASKIARGRE